MTAPDDKQALERQENREWIESLDYVFSSEGPVRMKELLRLLQIRAQEHGVSVACPGTTPYINTIPLSAQPPYPGKRELERRGAGRGKLR